MSKISMMREKKKKKKNPRKIIRIKLLKESSQRAIHGQTTLKQRYFKVYIVYTTLFKRRWTMMCPLGSDKLVKF